MQLEILNLKHHFCIIILHLGMLEHALLHVEGSIETAKQSAEFVTADERKINQL